MTGFATGVQRWCSCLDCVLTGLRANGTPCGRRLFASCPVARTFVGLHRVLSDSHKVRFKCGRATALQRQRFRSADMTAKHSRRDDFLQSLEGNQVMDVIDEYWHAKLSHSCLARELSI